MLAGVRVGLAAGAVLLLLGVVASAQTVDFPTAELKPAPKPSSKSPQIDAIEAALQAYDFAAVRNKVVPLLEGDFRDREPKLAAHAAYLLAQAESRAKNWQGLCETLEKHSDFVIANLDEARSDEFVLLLAAAFGQTNKYDAQDRLLELYVQSISHRHGQDSQAALKARVDAALSQMTVGRGEIAGKRLLSVLNAIELQGYADLFFNVAGQAAEHFAAVGYKAIAADILNRGLRSNLMQTDTGPGKGFLQFNVAAYMRDQGSFVEAERLNYRALTVFAEHFGKDSAESLLAYDGLAQTMHGAGKLANAEAAYEYIYNQGLKALGEDSPDLWSIMNNRAAVLRSLKLPIEALEFDTFAYKKRYEALGGGANDTVVSAMNIAHDLFEAERWQEAKDTLAGISRVVAQPWFDPRYRLRIERWLLYADYRLGAKKLTENDIRALDITFLDGADIEQVLSFLDLYADEAEKMGLLEQAAAYREDALTQAAGHLGDPHPIALDAMLSFTRLREKAYPKAAIARYRALDAIMFDTARSSVSGSGSLRAAKAMRVLADDMLGSLARFSVTNAEAAEIFAAALDNWKTMMRRTERQLRENAETTDDPAFRELIERYFSAFGRLREIVTTTLYSDELAPLDMAMRNALEALNVELQKRGLEPVTAWYNSFVEEVVPLKKPDRGDVIVDLAIIGSWSSDRSGEPLVSHVYAAISRHGAPVETVLIQSIKLKGTEPENPDWGQEFRARLRVKPRRRSKGCQGALYHSRRFSLSGRLRRAPAGRWQAAGRGSGFAHRNEPAGL